MDKNKKNSNDENEDAGNQEDRSNHDERYTDMRRGEYFLLPNRNSRTPRDVTEYIPGLGVARYNPTLRNLIPVRTGKINKEAMPADNAGLFSYLFMAWLTKYIWKAHKKGITIDDLPLISSYDSCTYNVSRLESLWQEEVHKCGSKNASFTIAAWKFVRTRVYISCLLLSCSVICGFISPTIIMRQILEYVQSPTETAWDGVKLVLLLILCDFLRTIFLTWTWIMNYRTALRLKASCSVLIYKKIIRLNNLENKGIGNLINIFSNDGQRLFDVIIYGPMIVSGPIVIICGISYVLWLFSPIALLGMITFLLFYPVQYFLSYINGYLRSKVVPVTDSRVRLMGEIFEYMKMIKMYTWEKYFSKELLDIRKKEEKWLHKIAYFQSLTVSLTPAIPVISAIITFLAYVSTGNNLTAAQAFPIMSLFWNQLRLALTSLKDCTRSFTNAFIALRRFQVFPFISLLNTQIRSSFMFLQVALINIISSKITFNRLKNVMILDENNCNIAKPIVKSQALAITNGTFVYDNIELQSNTTKKAHDNKKKQVPSTNDTTMVETLNKSKETKDTEVLTGITFEVAKGKLVGICGPVGSGKSSLLLAALGQLRIVDGNIMRDGSCAYVSQQAWIVNATFKENILFGEQFDTKRYYEALSVCGLKEDVNMLPGGDETEIGERGINLSGGQKQRIALARALYANQDIYFLDDPLSAVDSHVGSYIFENLILGALKDKSVILVTHQIQFLQYCNDIYVMQNGKVVEHGTHDELILINKEYTAMINSISLQSKNDIMKKGISISTSEAEGSNPTSDKNSVIKMGKIQEKGIGLMTQDKIETGTIKSNTYHTYIQAAGGYSVAALVFFVLFCSVSSSAFSSWWLAIWIKAGGGNVTVPGSNETILSDNIIDNPHFQYYQNIYAACIGIIVITNLIRGLAITFTTIKASTTLHNKIFQKIIKTSLTFFETTPSGRIQNMFSRDIDEVDNYLPLAVEYMIQNIFTCSLAIFFICSILPWFLLPLIVLGIIFLFVSKLFRVAIRDFKRMENMSRSPVLSFVTTTLQGLHTIHTFKKEKDFIKKFEELFDLNNLCIYMCQSVMRWSAVRLDSLAIITSSITAFLIIFLKNDIPAALAGLAMAYATQISGIFQYTVRLMSETEVRFISVERINYYLKTLKNEGLHREPLLIPPDNWPIQGKLKFTNVQMRYRKELPLILMDISFSINAGEKIGIVGRTGSGKSSLAVALFQLVEISSGVIKIDGIDISRVDLDLLRSKLSIIPQDPILFKGTIRSNLDPYKKYSDVELWNALEKSQLKTKIQMMSAQLDASIEFGGSNLSVGEKQLLCLARALLRNSKILILDEATAAVDPETEAMVQRTIQEECSGCTILTIAHRLQTVISYDRIIVMSKGTICEFDTPAALLSNPNSTFYKMIAVTEKPMK